METFHDISKYLGHTYKLALMQCNTERRKNIMKDLLAIKMDKILTEHLILTSEYLKSNQS